MMTLRKPHDYGCRYLTYEELIPSNKDDRKSKSTTISLGRYLTYEEFEMKAI